MVVPRSFLVYVAVGVVCAVIDIGLMQLLISGGMAALLAASVAFFVSLFANYFLQSRLTFKHAGGNEAFARFLILVALNYGITLLFVVAGLHFWNNALAGKVVSLPVIAVTGFLLGRFWVFKK